MTTPSEMSQWINQIPALMLGAGMEQALRKWVDLAVGELGRAMVKGQSPDGTPYKPLARPRPKGHNQQSGPLIDTGAMLRSLIADGPGHIEEYKPNQVRLGTSDRKAAFHQRGTRRIPARKFVGFTSQMLDDAERIVADQLVIRINAT